MVGERGDTLSGGEKQRIAIARAILRNPKIIFLDEPTSNLDKYSERLIINSLKSFLKNRTAVLITHQLPLLTLADQIIVMDNGSVAQMGTHEELIGQEGLYRRMCEEQMLVSG